VALVGRALWPLFLAPVGSRKLTPHAAIPIAPACRSKPPGSGTVTGMLEQFCPCFNTERLLVADCEAAKAVGTVNGLDQGSSLSMMTHQVQRYRFDQACHQPWWQGRRNQTYPGYWRQLTPPARAAAPSLSELGGQLCPAVRRRPQYLHEQSGISRTRREGMRQAHEGVSRS
jgi:hypothetical protein